jgi:hypothetical protein
MLKLKRMPDYTWNTPAPQGTWVMAPDKHFAPPGDPEGGVDPAALSCMLQGVQIIKPNGYFTMGDEGEWTSVSPWKRKRRKRPPVAVTLDRLDADMRAVTGGMDQIDAVLHEVGCKRKVFIEGNHEVWVDNMIEEWQEELGDAMRPDLNLRDMLGLKDRGYAFAPHGDYVRLGKLYVYHGGHFGGVSHARAHLLGLGSSVMYAHHHGQQQDSHGGFSAQKHKAWCIGMLAQGRKPFMKGKPTNWSHNFAIVHVEKDGSFHVEVVEIHEGKCHVYGKKITG